MINIIEGLFLRSLGVPPFSNTAVFLAALIIAKVLIVIDHLPLALRIAIRLTPYIAESRSFFLGWQDFVKHFDWEQFTAIQCWYLVLFFVFVTSRELILIIGPKKVYKLLFERAS